MYFPRRGSVGTSCLEETVSYQIDLSDIFAHSFLPNIQTNELISSDMYFKKVKKKLGRMTHLRIKLKSNGKNNMS